MNNWPDKIIENKALIGFFALFLLVVGWLFFVYFLNFGKLIFVGEIPFTVVFSNGERIECKSERCEKKVIAGEATFSVEKEGFVSAFFKEKVGVFSTKIIDVKLEKLLKSVEIGELRKDTIGNLFLEMHKKYPENFPLTALLNIPMELPNELKNSTVIAISPDGKYIILKIKNRSFLFNNESKVSKLIDNFEISNAIFSQNGEYFLFLGVKPKSKINQLVRVNLKNFESVSKPSFLPIILPRTAKNMRIFYLFLKEIVTLVDGENNLISINYLTAEKQNSVLKNFKIYKQSIFSNHFLVSKNENGIDKFKVFNLGSGVIYDLPENVRRENWVVFINESELAYYDEDLNSLIFYDFKQGIEKKVQKFGKNLSIESLAYWNKLFYLLSKDGIVSTINFF